MKKFETAKIELWLPDTFVGGDISKDLDLILSRMRAGGPDSARVAQFIEQNPSMFAMYAIDSKVGDIGSITNVNVTMEQTLSAITLDIYLDAVTKQLPSGFQVLDRKVVTLERYQAGRVVVETASQGRRVKQLVYVFKDGGTFWIATYTTSADEFDQRLPSFEQSIRTFRIKP